MQALTRVTWALVRVVSLLSYSFDGKTIDKMQACAHGFIGFNIGCSADLTHAFLAEADRGVTIERTVEDVVQRALESARRGFLKQKERQAEIERLQKEEDEKRENEARIEVPLDAELIQTGKAPISTTTRRMSTWRMVDPTSMQKIGAFVFSHQAERQRAGEAPSLRAALRPEGKGSVRGSHGEARPAHAARVKWLCAAR